MVCFIHHDQVPILGQEYLLLPFAALRYGTTILPTKPYTPRHKGKVERGVDYVQENGLKGRQFASLDDQNRHLLDWETSVADTRIHGTTRKHVGRVFREVERPTLRPLPMERFPNFHEAQRSVNRDGHVEVAKAYYSAPPEYLGRRVWVRWDGRTVRLFNHRRHGDEAASPTAAPNSSVSWAINRCPSSKEAAMRTDRIADAVLEDATPPDARLVPIAAAFAAITGTRPSPATCWRWRHKRGLKVTVYLGRPMITLREAREFLERTSSQESKLLPPARTNGQRAKAIEAAERALGEMGVN